MMPSSRNAVPRLETAGPCNVTSWRAPRIRMGRGILPPYAAASSRTCRERKAQNRNYSLRRFLDGGPPRRFRRPLGQELFGFSADVRGLFHRICVEISRLGPGVLKPDHPLAIDHHQEGDEGALEHRDLHESVYLCIIAGTDR